MLTRRNWLKAGLAACTGAPAIAASAAAGEAVPDEADFDVVVIGAGTGGLVAAIEAHDQGLRAVVIEKMDWAAGNSLYASGGIAAWGTAQQKEEGHDEPEDEFRADMMKVSEGRADPELVDAYCRHIGEDLEWLKKDIGVRFTKIARKPWPLRYRMHNVDGQGQTGGARLVRYLLAACEKRGIPVRFNTKAVELLTDDAYRVIGVRAKVDGGRIDFRAKDGVVVATGGFSANSEMLNTYMGGPLSRLVLRGSPYVTGDNVMLTRPLGAKLVHMDQFHCGPIVEATHANPNFVIDAGQGIDVNVKGVRIMDEAFTYTQKSMAAATRTAENYAYHIIDAHWPKSEGAAKKFIGMKTRVWVADTIGELAGKMGCDPGVLQATVDEYNRAFREGKLKELDPPCSLAEPQPLDRAPFYAFPFQGGITATFGGPKINARAQVITYEDTPIAGLYACGNAGGGLFFGNYIGGSQLGGATVFGRIAARECAAHHKAAKA